MLRTDGLSLQDIISKSDYERSRTRNIKPSAI